MSKLNLDIAKVAYARELAEQISLPILDMFHRHSTVTIERSALRLLGVDGVDHDQVPLPNVLVDQLAQANAINRGATYWLSKAMLSTGLGAQQVAEAVAEGRLNLLSGHLDQDTSFESHSDDSVINHGKHLAAGALANLDSRRQKRMTIRQTHGMGPKPWKYLIVASGNIYEDIPQAVAAARQGADIIAVIRSTGQSLLDFVPYGSTTYGTGGTYATGENFRLMRAALDEVGEELGRYIMLTNYASGLCMPEITTLAALEGLDMLLNDAMYGILFRDINVKRTLIDQFFSRMINARANIIINTGEDNYLTTADAYEEAHTVLASQLINERFALAAGMPQTLMGLGHAFEVDPDREDGFLHEIAMAQLVREVFPDAPLKYMPPTKHITGDIFAGFGHNSLFNLVTILTNQDIQLLGILTEAIHTPFLSDRALAIKNAARIHSAARHLGDSIDYKLDGPIVARSREILDETVVMLEKVEEIGLLKAIERKSFAQVSRTETGGKGLAGVFERADNYFNPFLALLQ